MFADLVMRKRKSLSTVWVSVMCGQRAYRRRGASRRIHGRTAATLFLHNGLDAKPCARGAQGVAIVLGPEAKIAWEQAGCQRLYFGTRIVATRLKLVDATNRSLIIFLVSSYAPKFIPFPRGIRLFVL